ncbi:MAG: slipin family protein [Anaerolineae bacterium]|nr:slipin family protein [Anaerolineae bacterium]
MTNMTGFIKNRLWLKQQAIVWEHERGLLYRDGKFVRVLMPGRYEFWRWQQMRLTKLSVRQMSQVITGQEILTADKVEVRVSLIAQYSVTDPVAAINAVENYVDQLYQDLQLSLREAVTSLTLDALLEARESLANRLLEQVAPLAKEYGVTLKRVGLRDVVLPGTVRNVFLKEVEADREGRAELVRARHEVAAARARANTAKILAENPNVARMQEIDALVKLAGKSGNVVMLPNIADMFVPRPTNISTTNTNETTNG